MWTFVLGIIERIFGGLIDRYLKERSIRENEALRKKIRDLQDEKHRLQKGREALRRARDNDPDSILRGNDGHWPND